ncbi:MAG: cation transporter [Thermodesulfovibrionales bacterium]|nr:cation transporter [Thermodesulfovibrionales bacterium]
MELLSIGLNKEKVLLYKWANVLALITIFYNIMEGLVSVYFGVEDETLALFGFGLDSFVEVISGIGIWHMINRIRRNAGTNSDSFERQALKITGTAFYILSVGLIVTALINLYQGHKPETTLWGIVISLVSIFTMWSLIHYKVKIGTQLGSQAIIADANCTKACLYLSVILLVSSAGYELTGIGGIDSVGTVLIAGFSFKEGLESFQKAKGITCSCQGKCD